MSSSLCAALAVLAASVVVDAAPSLTVKTSTPNVEVGGLENLRVTTTVVNSGDETIKLLNDPRGVLNPFPENSFIITDTTGSRPSFNGAKVKYSPTHAAGLDDPSVFTVLAPGVSIDVTHDLSAAYNFTRSGAGGYFIKPSNLFTYVDAGGTLKNLHATVGDVAEIKLSGNLAVSRVHHMKRAAKFSGCSDAQQSQLNTAATNAQKYASNAFSYLAATTRGTARYTTWFGVYTTSRRDTVRSNFGSINSNQFSGFTYNCDCALSFEGYYGYVFPGFFGTIYICDLFWKAPDTGTDSKAGSLIHESSQFTANGGTDDHAYGQADCMKLAGADPDEAIDNADNYEYFAENSPALS